MASAQHLCDAPRVPGCGFSLGRPLAFLAPVSSNGVGHSVLLLDAVLRLEEMTVLPGTAVIRDGRVRPSDAPGLGLDIDKEWLESRTD